MLTSRGWWFLVIVLSLLTVGLFDDRWTITLVALTLLLWFLGEWLLFALRARLAAPVLRLRRTIKDDRGIVDTLWVGHSFHIHVQVGLSHWLGLPFVRLVDLAPFGVERTRGNNERQGALSTGDPLMLDYSIRCPTAGKVRFEGVSVQLADFQGFFYHRAFLAAPQVLRVLPPLADAEGNRPTVKRHNLLPSPGQHRHLRPGTGSELLDLRDYLPGDPPKTIAWKVSARRDRLITKEFESEVPIRCTLFVDTSHSVRVGPSGRNALARLVEVAASVAQAAAGVRDLTGLCVFDETGVSSMVRPARGSRHVVRLLNLLADAAGLAPAAGQPRLHTLLPLAHAFVQEVYPSLLRPDVNRVPGWLPWLWPMPAFDPGRASLWRHVWRGLVIGLAFLPVIIPCLLLCFFQDMRDVASLLGNVLQPVVQVLVPVPQGMLTIIGICLGASLLIAYYVVVNFLLKVLGLVFARRRRQLARWRKQLAAILSEHYGLAPGGLSLFLEDNARFGFYLQRLLAEHHVPYPVPLYDRRGRYLFASAGKAEVLARALIHAVGRGHDNELFVLLVDLLDLGEEKEPLLRAIRMTLARHHQVVVICPWPPGVPPPRPRGCIRLWGTQGVSAPPRKPVLTAVPAFSQLPGVQSTVQQATAERLHQAFHELRQSLARMGVVVVCAAEGDPVQLILDRIDRLRGLGARRR
jgi:uncharacterized protein (DUF58 family)